MSAKFGPAGNSEAFSIKYKTTLQAPGYLEVMGLDHYEYQCGRGVKVSDKIAFALKDKAKELFGENHPSNSSQNQQPVRTAGTCPNCGAELEPGAEYCKKCGYPVEK